MKDFDLKNWLDEIQTKLKKIFEDNLLYIGYHGSYKRGEATENSDIDLIVILKNCNVEYLKKYKSIIGSMPFSEKCCGFISSEKEIKNWSKSDIFQFYYETENLFGDIKKIITPPQKKDMETAIKTNAEMLYHSACHSFLYDENAKETLKSLYKMVFFILQTKYFLLTNTYIPTKVLLCKKLTGIDREILDICINRENISSFNDKKIEELYEKLISWCSSLV